MSNWKSHTACPYEDCGSSDAFSYNTESMAGRCHSCDRRYPRDRARKFDWAEDEYPTHRKDDWEMKNNTTPQLKAVQQEKLDGVFMTLS